MSNKIHPIRKSAKPQQAPKMPKSSKKKSVVQEYKKKKKHSTKGKSSKTKSSVPVMTKAKARVPKARGRTRAQASKAPGGCPGCAANGKDMPLGIHEDDFCYTCFKAVKDFICANCRRTHDDSDYDICCKCEGTRPSWATDNWELCKEHGWCPKTLADAGPQEPDLKYCHHWEDCKGIKRPEKESPSYTPATKPQTAPPSPPLSPLKPALLKGTCYVCDAKDVEVHEGYSKCDKCKWHFRRDVCKGCTHIHKCLCPPCAGKPYDKDNTITSHTVLCSKCDYGWREMSGNPPICGACSRKQQPALERKEPKTPQRPSTTTETDNGRSTTSTPMETKKERKTPRRAEERHDYRFCSKCRGVFENPLDEDRRVCIECTTTAEKKKPKNCHKCKGIFTVLARDDPPTCTECLPLPDCLLCQARELNEVAYIPGEDPKNFCEKCQADVKSRTCPACHEEGAEAVFEFCDACAYKKGLEPAQKCEDCDKWFRDYDGGLCDECLAFYKSDRSLVSKENDEEEVPMTPNAYDTDEDELPTRAPNKKKPASRDQQPRSERAPRDLSSAMDDAALSEFTASVDEHVATVKQQQAALAERERILAEGEKMKAKLQKDNEEAKAKYDALEEKARIAFKRAEEAQKRLKRKAELPAPVQFVPLSGVSPTNNNKRHKA